MSRLVDPQAREMETLARLLSLAGRVVLDVGCGDGRTSRRVARTAASVLGVDPDDAAIQQAQASADAEGLQHCRFCVADTLMLARAPASVDVALFSRSL